MGKGTESGHLSEHNIPRMSAQKLVDELSRAYGAIISGGLSGRDFPAVMLWGPPGVGKSQAVHQIAERIAAETKKSTIVCDVRLLLFNPIDLRGIPTANEDKTLAIWLKPKIFAMDERRDVVNFLFLDEISSAPPSVQAAAYQITLDRVIGEHRLPDNCIVIAAGNRVTDKSVAYKMPKALANRMMHIEVEENFSAWKAWAIRNGIHEKVLGFLSFRQNYLMEFDAKKEDLAFATPRTWEMVSRLLTRVDADVEKVYPLIAGLIGVGTAMEFRTWTQVYDRLPDIKGIFDGKEKRVPKSPDVLYALISSMTVYAREHRKETDRIANSIRYAEGFSPDFAALLMRNYLYLEDGYRKTLLGIPEFAGWMQTKGSLMNGYF